MGKKPNIKRKLPKKSLTEILKVPESVVIQDLLVIFQNEDHHVALVVNENQETIGIISVEDIMDVVFGEVKEGSDKKTFAPLIGKKKRVEVDGEVTIGTLSENIECEISEKYPPYKTVAWLCMDLLSRFPQKNDCIKIPDTNITLLILSTKNKKAQKVAVQIKEDKKKK